MLTHYTRDDSDFEIAYCGRRMTDADRHSLTPTCGACASALAMELAIDSAVEAMRPLDADELHALDRVLNAGWTR